MSMSSMTNSTKSMQGHPPLHVAWTVQWTKECRFHHLLWKTNLNGSLRSNEMDCNDPGPREPSYHPKTELCRIEASTSTSREKCGPYHSTCHWNRIHWCRRSLPPAKIVQKGERLMLIVFLVTDSQTPFSFPQSNCMLWRVTPKN